jgi:hypothetical protein
MGALSESYVLRVLLAPARRLDATAQRWRRLSAPLFDPLVPAGTALYARPRTEVASEAPALIEADLWAFNRDVVRDTSSRGAASG